MNIVSLKRVASGDLITTEFLNKMIDEINRLSKAVAGLERTSARKPAIKKNPARRKK